MNLAQRIRYSPPLIVNPLEFKLSHLKEGYVFICTWVSSSNPFWWDLGRDQHLSLLDCSPPQYPDTQSPSQPTFAETQMLFQQDYHTELQISQMELYLTSRNHLKYFKFEYCNRCWLPLSSLHNHYPDDLPRKDHISHLISRFYCPHIFFFKDSIYFSYCNLAISSVLKRRKLYVIAAKLGINFLPAKCNKINMKGSNQKVRQKS